MNAPVPPVLPAATPVALPSIRALALERGRHARERLMQQCLARIEALDATVNAIPTRVAAQTALDGARSADRAVAAGEPVGLLAGLPYAAKDTFATAGVRTTRGSPIFADHVPARDDPIVARLKAAGAVLAGKSNAPEFAAGSQTFNPVLGRTCNPWDPSRTVGGSTGGGAAAVACGLVKVADGSDLAASLRNPASFCGVVGLRPSTRLAPDLRENPNAFGTLSLVGALGATVDDLRLTHRCVWTPPAARPPDAWAAWLAADAARPRPDLRGLRLRWSADGARPDGPGFPVEGAVRSAFLRAIDALRAAGADLVEMAPDFDGADEAFLALRGAYFVDALGELYETERARMKDTVVWNIEAGLKLDARALARANRLRSQVFERVSRFMEGCDGWLLPTAQVLPFPLDVPYPQAIDGTPLPNYVAWLQSCYWITVAGHPAVSLPAGFAREGDGPALPFGLQVMGRWGEDEALLDTCETLEAALAPLNSTPPAAGGPAR